MQTLLKPRPEEPNLVVDQHGRTTPLWGVWEMWCVLPDAANGVPGGGHARAFGSAVKMFASPKGKSKKATWLDQVRSIGLFDSAEGFWGVVDCTLPPSQLSPGTTYYMLRRNIAPMWEHEANRRGGRWVMRFRQQRQQRQEGSEEEGRDHDVQQPKVDRAWETLCIALIGEQLPCSETEVCGVALRRAERRWEWKLSLWTRTAADRDTQLCIGRFLKTLLQLEDGALQYLPHRELMLAGEEGRWDIPFQYEI